jgi:hypothetical protein
VSTEAKSKPKAKFRHGTISGYNAHECRCRKCRRAWAEVITERRDKRGKLKSGDPRHGTLNGYTNYRCRCPLCRTAFAKYQAARRIRRAEEAEAEAS